MKKRVSSLLFKIYIQMLEKKYKRLKYLFMRSDNNVLIVSFSGFAGKGSAKYNYMNTLQTINANKLFILDDFGYNRQGSYYLGEDGDFFLIDMVKNLIQKIKTENNIEHLIMIGSSKGGTAALFYASIMEADACIIGAPQYYIGDYLSIEKHLPILEGIMGKSDEEAIQKLNNIIRDSLYFMQNNKPKVYIHYSPAEHTYPEHIVDMIHDLKKGGYEVEEDADYEYMEHQNVAKYFPKYLTNTLRRIIE